MKKMNKKGFTLAELLIVVAIIAVLVAIAIPVFSAQLDKAKLATATANARSVYAEYVTACLADSTTGNTASLQTSINAAELKDCTATVNANDVTIKTSNNKYSQSFSINLG